MKIAHAKFLTHSNKRNRSLQNLHSEASIALLTHTERLNRIIVKGDYLHADYVAFLFEDNYKIVLSKTFDRWRLTPSCKLCGNSLIPKEGKATCSLSYHTTIEASKCFKTVFRHNELQANLAPLQEALEELVAHQMDALEGIVECGEFANYCLALMEHS